MAVNFIALNVRTLAVRYGRKPDEVIERWSERAAMREYDGGMTRIEAEGAALADVRRWLAENGEPVSVVDE